MNTEDNHNNEEIFTARGMQNPRVVDLINYNLESNRLEIACFNLEEWQNDAWQREQFQEKMNNYLGFILDGFLNQQFPHYSEKAIEIILFHLGNATENDQKMINSFAAYLNSINMYFSEKILTKDEILNYFNKEIIVDIPVTDEA